MVERKTAHFLSWYGRYVVLLGFAFHAWIESTYTNSALATTTLVGLREIEKGALHYYTAPQYQKF